MLEAVTTGVIAFAATNVDDLVVLSVLAARRDAQFGTRQIVLGQLLGVGLLVAVSFAASLGLLALPDEAVGLLGFVPIALGLTGLRRALRGEDGADGDGEPAPVLTTMGVTSITVAGGADNVAVYAPLFASIGPGDAAVTLVVFAVGVLTWCAVALLVGTRTSVVRTVEWAGDYAVPVVLVGLGAWIVAASGLL